MEGQVGAGKCQWVHRGKEKCRSMYKIHEKEITQAESYKYLGDHVSNGWDTLYTKRWEKAQGYSATCLAMCTEMSLGYQLFSIAKLLHASIFLNGTLVNMETWPHSTTKRIEAFERIEQTYCRKILAAHSKTPLETLYLELGILPFRFHLTKKRILYYQNILQRENHEITKMVAIAQKEECSKGDFYEQVKADMGTIGISEDELTENSKSKLKEMLRKRLEKAAYEHLIAKAKKHSKVNENMYSDCNGAPHLKDPRFTPDLVSILFRIRTRTYLVKNNFRNNYRNTNIHCPLCHNSDDNQQHLFECSIIKGEIEVDCKLEDCFSLDMDTLHRAATTIKKIDRIRTELLNQK